MGVDRVIRLFVSKRGAKEGSEREIEVKRAIEPYFQGGDRVKETKREVERLF